MSAGGAKGWNAGRSLHGRPADPGALLSPHQVRIAASDRRGSRPASLIQAVDCRVCRRAGGIGRDRGGARTK